MPRFAKYSQTSGRIIVTGQYPELLDMLPVSDDVQGNTHYVRWTATDANGRPVDPEVVPRTLLVAEAPVEGEDRSFVRIPTDLPELVVMVDGVRQDPEAPVDGAVVVELESALPRTFRVRVDEPAYYLPEIKVRVL